MGKKRMGAWKHVYAKRRDAKVTQRNKLKRVLQSNGLNAAQDYAAKHQIQSTLRSLIERRHS